MSSLTLAAVLLVAAPLVSLTLVLLFRRWLVSFTGTAESLRELALVLRAFRDLFRVQRR